MRKLFKILSNILAVVLLLGLCACRESNRDDDTIDIPENFPLQSAPIGVKYTQYDFVRDGKSDYTIVIPENCGENIVIAAQEINTFLLKSCGTTLNIKNDSEVEYTSSSKFISLGNNSVAQIAGVVADYSELGDYGYVLRTVDSSIFINGAGREVGTLNGTYDFLKYQLGVETYAKSEIAYNEYTSVKLVDVNVKDKPDIPGYIPNQFVVQDPELKRRFRNVQRVEVLGMGSITPYHNFLSWLPVSTYYDAHKGWYNEKKSQLCLTAHGDEDEYNLMVETVFERMYEEVMTYDLNVVTFTLQDNLDRCLCKDCLEQSAYYGADSGMLIKFCNILSDKFAARFAEEGIEKKLDILFFAYYYYTNAPKLGVIECKDNVFPIIAPINEMDASASIYSDKNTNIRGIIDRWTQIADRIGFWVYSTNFWSSYMYPWDPFNCLQDNYSYFASCNPYYFFDEGGAEPMYNDEYAASFVSLQSYLNAKLAWDTEADVQALTADFFTHYYKDASQAMYNYYTKYRLHLKIIFEKYGYTVNLRVDALNAKYFDFGTLLSWKACFEDAYKAIEKYKTTDYELYNELSLRIMAEELTVDFTTLKLYKSYYSKTDYERSVSEFYDKCYKVGIVTGDIDSLIEELLD